MSFSDLIALLSLLFAGWSWHRAIEANKAAEKANLLSQESNEISKRTLDASLAPLVSYRLLDIGHSIWPKKGIIDYTVSVELNNYGSIPVVITECAYQKQSQGPGVPVIPEDPFGEIVLGTREDNCSRVIKFSIRCAIDDPMDEDYMFRWAYRDPRTNTLTMKGVTLRIAPYNRLPNQTPQFISPN